MAPNWPQESPNMTPKWLPIGPKWVPNRSQTGSSASDGFEYLQKYVKITKNTDIFDTFKGAQNVPTGQKKLSK